MQKIREIFKNAAPGDSIVIPPGEYFYDGEITIVSRVSVKADGAVFYFPQNPENIHMNMFYGKDICDFFWCGGKFVGYVYNPERKENLWEPNALSVAIHIDGGKNLEFKNISGENLAGAVLYVCGDEEKLIKNIKVDNINANNCGRFMWDYGYLWQRITFPENHTEAEVENAYKYMPQSFYSENLCFDGERISSERLPKEQEYDNAVTFFGEKLPPEIKKGRYYYAEESDGGLIVRERLDDAPIKFTPGEYDCKLFRGIYSCYHAIYAPLNSGRSKGSVDIQFGEDVSVTNCTISASGDASHFQGIKNGVISGNVIKGARMGAMFLSFGCENMLVTENIVDGGNGSRVLTVETGSKNVKIINNIFKNGGRGTWIDTPNGIEIKNNIFCRNTRKSTPDPYVGRISPTEGTFERYAEIYFTTRTHGAIYGNISFENNVIITGKGCTASLAFNAHGKGINVKGNLFDGEVKSVYVSPDCEDVNICENSCITAADKVANESFDIPGTIYLSDGMRK